MNLEQIQQSFATLKEIKQEFASRGWFPATSGNLSLRIGDGVAVTASGKDKTKDTPEDFLLVDLQGNPVFPTQLKPSAETLIHTAIYKRFPHVSAVFHVHTLENNVISSLYFKEKSFSIRGHELIKALGKWEEDAEAILPIVENYHHIPTLAAAVQEAIQEDTPGVLIHNHGIYVWGEDAFSAKRHLEAFEFLFAYELLHMRLKEKGRDESWHFYDSVIQGKKSQIGKKSGSF